MQMMNQSFLYNQEKLTNDYLFKYLTNSKGAIKMGNEDNMLSQDEIDALLSIPDDEAETDDEDVQEKTVTERVSDYLSSNRDDSLEENGHISIGTSPTTLPQSLNNKVSITTPTISIMKKPEIYQSFSFEHVNVTVNYVEGFVGQNIFVVQKGDAAIIADIMLGGDGTDPDHDLTEIHLSAVQEVMNQMMGAAATSMSTIFEKKVNISPPSIELKDASDDEMVGEAIDEEVFVKVAFQLQVGDLIDSSIMQLIPHLHMSWLRNCYKFPEHKMSHKRRQLKKKVLRKQPRVAI